MADNLFEAQYDVTKKSKLRKFYDSNKILIFSSILILIIFFASLAIYLEYKERKKISLSENYVIAKTYLEKGEKIKAVNILKDVILANDPTYSPLCLFLILNQNLIEDHKELSLLFNHLLANNKFDKEIKFLFFYKKALFDSNFVSESELLEETVPLLNSALWKPHALLLLGDYFLSKREYLKAREFYIQVLSIKDLHNDLYSHAKSQLVVVANDK